MERVIIIHYHEVALKGNNRDFFENTLIENIKKSLVREDYSVVEKRYGSIIAHLNESADEELARSRIKKVFGVANFAFGFASKLDLATLKNDIWAHLKENPIPRTFRVTAKRSNKNFPKNSQEVAVDVGSFLYEKFEGMAKVDLKDPKLNCFCEIGERNSFFYFKKEKGYAGLPVGTAGKVLSLISSGFDSPIASWKMMRRGAKVVYLHFHSYPYTTKASVENVKAIIKKLDEYQFGSKAYFVPFAEIQKEISVKVHASQRVILYRRFMLRIAERIAKKEGIKALVTGDSLAQVASQTLDNIFVISQAVSMPILRPLIGDNKNDIIDIATEIGTYEISSQPYEDCCSLFMPSSPETHGKLDMVLQEEKKLDIESMINDALNNVEIFKIDD
ncbi:tRNA 4-thiouridine(8) synthase ThiI [Candidatus Azambacteria bacterium]|nr:tRNA 4-thiouridine(8) synthase ThiI [Candidatus Azambacteria bacterium]